MRVAFVLPLAAVCARAASAQIPSLTEKLVTVGGHPVQVWTGGPATSEAQSPLVIFENGWNGAAGTWARVAPEVAKFARVLLYNRGGAGRSEWDGQPPTPDHVARNLRELVRVIGFSQQYLLVGHSWGGPLIRVHAVLYRDAVSGLVYVDPGSPCVRERAFEAAGYGAHTAALVEFSKQAEPRVGGVHPDDHDMMRRVGTDTLPDVPVVLVIGLKAEGPPPPMRAWMAARGINPEALGAARGKQKIPCLSPLVTEVPRGFLIATPFSGHNIQQQEPELVVAAIRRALFDMSPKRAGERGAQEPARPRPENTPAASVALSNVSVIDGTGAASRPGMTALIQDGVIRDVFRTGERTVPAGTEIHDLTGHYVIPGLINTHVHFQGMFASSRDSGFAALARMLYAGVTTVREMVGNTRLTADLARAASTGERPMPSVYYAALMAGPTFFTDPRVPRTSAAFQPGEAPWAQAIRPETDLKVAVSRAAETGASGIKIYADLDATLVRRIVAEAHRQGMQAWAHSTLFPTRPIDVVRAGVDGVSHVCGMVWQVLDSVPVRYANRGSFDPRRVDVNASRFVELLGEMKRRGTMFDATANVFFRNTKAREAGCTPELMTRILRAAHEAGVRISTGTDYFIPAGEPDPTLFSEIAYLVERRVLNPAEAITAATLNGARAIGIEKTHGSVEKGKVADLVVLSADPTRDIAALQAIVMVVKAGRIYRSRP